VNASAGLERRRVHKEADAAFLKRRRARAYRGKLRRKSMTLPEVAIHLKRALEPPPDPDLTN
jgi:hypothetical protein